MLAVAVDVGRGAESLDAGLLEGLEGFGELWVGREVVSAPPIIITVIHAQRGPTVWGSVNSLQLPSVGSGGGWRLIRSSGMLGILITASASALRPCWWV